MGERVLVAMSGGVDSSVAASLMVREGHDVIGVTMKTFCYSGTPASSKTCCGLDGIMDAKSVCERLGIPHYVFDVEEDFTRDVIDDFVHEYARGRTPNPCVRCNSNTKFRDLLARGRALGCDRIATGHYVRTERRGPEVALLRGQDRDKDQAYFLWGLPCSMLTSLIFPLGHLTKADVRAMAHADGLTTADKPESQEICFVPSGNYRDLLRTRLEEQHPAFSPGRIVLADGTVVGEHQGYAGFTVGQRRGLGGGFGHAMFVIEVDPDSGDVTIGPRGETLGSVVEIGELHWLTADPPGDGAAVSVQVRHRAPAASGRIWWRDDHARMHLDEPVASITPGQSGVLFSGDRVLGGGRIRAAEKPSVSLGAVQPDDEVSFYPIG